ncbi:hypothetical protein LguiB_029712 [Lonicera macranthoides]
MDILQVSEADSIQKVSFKNNDADDQFPATIKKVHQFYFVKFQSVEYVHLKAKIKEAEKRISDLNQSRSRVAEKLEEMTLDRDYATTLHKKNISRGSWYRYMISWKTREMENLQKALDEELNTPKKPRGRGVIGVCSPMDEINERVRLTFDSSNISTYDFF